LSNNEKPLSKAPQPFEQFSIKLYNDYSDSIFVSKDKIESERNDQKTLKAQMSGLTSQRKKSFNTLDVLCSGPSVLAQQRERSLSRSRSQPRTKSQQFALNSQNQEESQPPSSSWRNPQPVKHQTWREPQPSAREAWIEP
jgi:hypothetical protein